jgi:phytoene/squalene synthetase
MDKYDPLHPPDPRAWLDLDEAERLDLVSEYHEPTGEEFQDTQVHAAIHVAVENQLAEHLPSVEAALQRLQAEGLDRHNAVHAIASVLAEHLHDIIQGHSPETDPNEPYYRALEKLSVATWGAD